MLPARKFSMVGIGNYHFQDYRSFYFVDGFIVRNGPTDYDDKHTSESSQPSVETISQCGRGGEYWKKDFYYKRVTPLSPSTSSSMTDDEEPDIDNDRCRIAYLKIFITPTTDSVKKDGKISIGEKWLSKDYEYGNYHRLLGIKKYSEIVDHGQDYRPIDGSTRAEKLQKFIDNKDKSLNLPSSQHNTITY
jgi:hypothetical protein